MNYIAKTVNGNVLTKVGRWFQSINVLFVYSKAHNHRCSSTVITFLQSVNYMFQKSSFVSVVVVVYCVLCSKSYVDKIYICKCSSSNSHQFPELMNYTGLSPYCWCTKSVIGGFGKSGCVLISQVYTLRLPVSSQVPSCPRRLRSVNYMVSSVLYDQFRALNEDFRRAVSLSGEFRGSVREFRRRHQALCQSVENADQFIMISNVAGFWCRIFNLILILYCTIFFVGATVAHDAMSSIMYAYWLASTLISLSLTACQAIVINHVVGW